MNLSKIIDVVSPPMAQMQAANAALEASLASYQDDEEFDPTIMELAERAAGTIGDSATNRRTALTFHVTTLISPHERENCC